MPVGSTSLAAAIEGLRPPPERPQGEVLQPILGEPLTPRRDRRGRHLNLPRRPQPSHQARQPANNNARARSTSRCGAVRKQISLSDTERCSSVRRSAGVAAGMPHRTTGHQLFARQATTTHGYHSVTQHNWMLLVDLAVSGRAHGSSDREGRMASACLGTTPALARSTPPIPHTTHERVPDLGRACDIVGLCALTDDSDVPEILEDHGLLASPASERNLRQPRNRRHQAAATPRPTRARTGSRTARRAGKRRTPGRRTAHTHPVRRRRRGTAQRSRPVFEAF